MLARLARALPEGDYQYEPKWDGFRCLAVVRADGTVALHSRHGRPLERYFPELAEPLRALGPAALDGELVVARGGTLDFGLLLSRVHPSATRVAQLAREAPAAFVAFDLLAEGARDLQAAPLRERRRALEAVLARAGPPLRLTPATRDRAVAQGWLERLHGAGVDGVMAKALDAPYAPGRRTQVKVKRRWTAECVVGGFRVYAGLPLVASLLLGLWDGPVLRHVGVASSFPDRERHALFTCLAPAAVPLAGHPWERGFNVGASPLGRLKGSAGRWEPGEMAQDWTAVRPALVVEVAYDQVDAGRLRHPARLVRWRPDRDAASCTADQLGVLGPGDLELRA